MRGMRGWFPPRFPPRHFVKLDNAACGHVANSRAMASESAERWNNKRRPPELVERDRRLIAASPVETVTDEDRGKTANSILGLQGPRVG
jgi:hypothetical protein